MDVAEKELMVVREFGVVFGVEEGDPFWANSFGSLAVRSMRRSRLRRLGVFGNVKTLRSSRNKQAVLARDFFDAGGRLNLRAGNDETTL